MTSRLLLPLLVLTPIVVLVASPATDEAQQRLRTAINEALAIAEKAPDHPTLINRVTPLLEKHVNFAAMTRRAIGPGWKQFDAAQQSKAIALFSKLVTRSYCSKFTIGERAEVTYKSATSTAPERVDVTTSFIYKGQPYAVVYRMEMENGWHTTDVVVEGVSVVANYRSQLDPIFKKGGVEGVLTSLERSSLNSQK